MINNHGTAGRAGSTGGMALAEPEVVWRSGATISDRTTAVWTTTNYSLIGNRRFDQYRGINIWFDSDGAAGSGLFSYVPVVAVTDMIIVTEQQEEQV